MFTTSATTGDYGSATEHENENTVNETTHISSVVVPKTIDDASNADNVNNNVHMVGLPIAPTFPEKRKTETFSSLIGTDIHIDGHDEHRLPIRYSPSVSSKPVDMHEGLHDIVPSSDRASMINKNNANVVSGVVNLAAIITRGAPHVDSPPAYKANHHHHIIIIIININNLKHYTDEQKNPQVVITRKEEEHIDIVMEDIEDHQDHVKCQENVN